MDAQDLGVEVRQGRVEHERLPAQPVTDDLSPSREHVLCSTDGECTPANALYALVAGNSGVQGAPGAAPAGPAALRLVVAAHPSCADVALTLPAGASMSLTYRYGAAAADTATLKLGLPPGTIDAAALPLALYLGADGATYLDEELTTLAAKGAP